MATAMWVPVLLGLSAAGLTPLAGPAQGGSIVTLPLPAGCSAVSFCRFGAENGTAVVSGDDVVCTAPPALRAGAATTLLEAEALSLVTTYCPAAVDGSASLHHGAPARASKLQSR